VEKYILDEIYRAGRNKLTEETESITAILHPGFCNDGKWLEQDTVYSMFGTDRKIRDFSLTIDKLDDEDTTEHCYVSGFVSYTAEVDFLNETIDDMVFIGMFLSPQRFNNLAEIIKTKKADTVRVILSRVVGFYSEWSPSIRTSNIKILTRGGDQKIVHPEGCDITPPRIGQVGEFELSISHRSKLNPKQDFREINIDKLFEEEEEEETDLVGEFTEMESVTNKVLLTQLVRNELAIEKLRTPLWLIYFLLLLFLLYAF